MIIFFVYTINQKLGGPFGHHNSLGMPRMENFPILCYKPKFNFNFYISDVPWNICSCKALNYAGWIAPHQYIDTKTKQKIIINNLLMTIFRRES